MGRHPAIRRPPVLAAAGRRASERGRTPQDNVRSESVWVIERTLASRAPSDLFLAGALGRLDERDHGLLRELVLGTLRWMRRLDAVIERAADRKLEAIDPPLHVILRLAAYQLLFLDRIPPHAAVDEAVTQASHVGSRAGAGFVNAVLRRIARSPRLEDWPLDERDPTRRLALETSHPDWLVARWLDRFGAQRTRQLLAVNNQPKPLQLLCFRDLGGRELAAERLIDQGLEVEPSRWAPLGLIVRHGNPLRTTAFGDGLVYLQDEISQCVALLPPPRPGERILDAAAAPGGKSLAALAWEPAVRPVLADLALDRLASLRENLVRLRRSLPVLAADAGRPAVAAGSFDRVLLDLPCSGTGTFRRHPELKWRLTAGEVDRLAADGRRLVAASAELVRPGGLLVVVTCSLEREENEQMVETFLAAQREFEPIELATPELPQLAGGVEGVGRWRVLPADDHDGFSLHALRRRGTGGAGGV